MVKNKEESKDCKEMKLKHKKNKGGGYKERKDPLTEKAPRHSASAMKKDADAISNEGAVVPTGEHKVAQDAVIADFEKKIDKIEIPDKDEESVILQYKDSEKENLLEKVFAYEKMAGITIPLDYDSDSESFLVSIKKSEIDKFRTFMKDFEEILFSETADKKIEDVQSNRSSRAIALDKSKTASRVGRKENPSDLKDWAENPARLDLLGVDAGEV